MKKERYSIGEDNMLERESVGESVESLLKPNNTMPGRLQNILYDSIDDDDEQIQYLNPEEPNSYQNSIQQKEQELLQLNNMRVKTLESIIQEKLSTIQQLQLKIHQMESKQKSHEAEQLKYQHNEYKKKFKKAKEILTSKDMELSEIKSQLDDYCNKYISQKTKAKELENKTIDLSRRLEESKKENQEKQNIRIKELESFQEIQIQKLNTLLQQKDQQFQVLKNKFQKSEEEQAKDYQDRLKNEKAKEASILYSKEKEINSAKMQITELQSQLDSNKKHLEKLKLETQLSEKELRETVKTFENVIQTKTQSIVTLESELSNLKKQYFEKNLNQEHQIKELNEKNKSLEFELIQKRVENEHSSTDAQNKFQEELRQIKHNSQQIIQNLQQEISLLQTETKNNTNFQNQISQQYQEELEKKEKLFEVEKEKWEKEKEKIEKSKAEIKSQINLKNMELENKNEEIRILKKKNEQKTDECNDFQNQLSDTLKREKDLQKELSGIHELYKSHLEKQKIQLDDQNKARLLVLQDENEKLRSKNEENILKEREKKIELENINRPKEGTAYDSLEFLKNEFHQNIAGLEKSELFSQKKFIGSPLSLKKDVPDQIERSQVLYESESQSSRYTNKNQKQIEILLEELKMKRIEVANYELKAKIASDEKQYLNDELHKFKEQVLQLKEEKVQSEMDKCRNNSKSEQLRKEVEKLRNERDRIASISNNLKGELNSYKNQKFMKFIENYQQEDELSDEIEQDFEQKDSKKRIVQLETQVLQLRQKLQNSNVENKRQSKRNSTFSTNRPNSLGAYNSHSKPLYQLTSYQNNCQILNENERFNTEPLQMPRSRSGERIKNEKRYYDNYKENEDLNRPQILNIRDKIDQIKNSLYLQGTNIEEEKPLIGQLNPSNTKRQTQSQYKVAEKIKKNIEKNKQKPKVRNYNLKE